MAASKAAPVSDTWERKRVRTSLEIERAGLRLLSRHGIDSVTVEQVAAAAGISTRTFFRYFRNVPDLLTGVPTREVDRSCALVAERPPGEGLLDAFRTALGAPHCVLDDELAALEDEALALWGDVVRRDPEMVRAKSHTMTVMVTGYEAVIRARLGLEGADDDLTAGVLASALAGIIWFVYIRWLEDGGAGSLPAKFDEAFAHLGALFDMPREAPRR